MGPAVFKRKKGETQYSVRVFPIGGYVSMEGEDQDSDDDGAFNKKPVWQKMIIVAAGAFMNILLGVIIMCIMLSRLVGARSQLFNEPQQGRRI